MKKSEIRADVDRRLARLYDRINTIHQSFVRRTVSLSDQINAARKATADLDDRTGRWVSRLDDLARQLGEHQRASRAAIAELRSKEPDRNGRLDALTQRIADLEQRMNATIVAAEIHDAPAEHPAEPRSLDAQILDVLHRGRGLWMTPSAVHLNLPDLVRDDVPAYDVRDHLAGLYEKRLVETNLISSLLAYRFPGGDR